ncbi:hypothetical protein ACP4OV_030173 [Aristida adscensionis]
MPPSPAAPACEAAPPWLKALPVAPEFRPTAAEFADPVAYLLRIEPAAAPYGICKVVPPLPPPPKRATLAGLTRSFAALHPGDPSPTFPTRHQQLGLCPRRPRPALKPVWRSHKRYTLPQFEARAAASRRALLAGLAVPASRQLSPLDHEALFWRAAADRPVSVEYASDMPGSGFGPPVPLPRHQPAADVGETPWNMRGVARSPGSLLQFMREEVPGVTSPMLYVAMTFSWFAWHVEDHDLHSLNYLHSGASKTWYGVPRDAALAFEEVVRVHGYGGEVNSLETFALLGDKTTVMSPEVLVESGIPCCRLVQNAGEFVVTFPGSYHCGFSHGFNCGEASNIATPEWLNVAKEAAVRRASINRPPMVSHYQLLYELALSMWLRDPSSGAMEPRSSRLKEKKKGEGEQLVKKIFVRNVIEDNILLSYFQRDGSSCIILPPNAREGRALATLLAKCQSKTKPRLLDGLCSNLEAPEDSGCTPLNGALGENDELRYHIALPAPEGSSLSVCSGKKLSPTTCMHDCVHMSSSSDAHNTESDKGDITNDIGLLDQGLLSCVTCGILSFSCVAVIKPGEHAAKWLMSADSSLINNQLVSSGESHLVDALRRSNFEVNKIISDAATCHRSSALDLLASAYGDQSESDEDVVNKKNQVPNGHHELLSHMPESQPNSSSNGGCDGTKATSGSKEFQERPPSQSSQGIGSANILNGPKGVRTRNKYQLKMMLSEGFERKDMYSEMQKKVQSEPSKSNKVPFKPLHDIDHDASRTSSMMYMGDNISSTTMMHDLASSIVKSDKDSSRMHVFCLEHAVEVEKQLQSIGGAHIFLLCRPEYPKIEAEARLLAEEMEVEYDWKDIHFREASMDDREKIQEVVRDEEAVPANSDWAVKLGMNLYYSANLAKSPLYNKQLPYNRVIYKVFGCSSPNNSPVKLKTYSRRQARQKKIVLAGRWCGKVWMSNQVHPYLARITESQKSEKIEETNSYHLDQKPTSEPVDNSSREVGSGIKSRSITVIGKTSNREIELVEKANTKRSKHTEEDNSKASKDVAEANSPSPVAMVLRSSSRIATKKNNLKSKMKEDDNDPGSRPKPKVKEDNDGPASHLSARSPRQKTKGDSKKQTKKTRGEKRRASSPVALKDEEQPSDVEGSSISTITKQQLSLHKQITKVESQQPVKRTRESRRVPTSPKSEQEYKCTIEGCSMSFGTKQELSLHKRDICPVKGCCKKFFSHKYLLQHRKVHIDDRPLKCSWKGCNMAFKWPWARTEHMRVHTGDRPYVCEEPGCEQTFRFVSDFSRHKRRTGHLAKKAKTKG